MKWVALTVAATLVGALTLFVAERVIRSIKLRARPQTTPEGMLPGAAPPPMRGPSLPPLITGVPGASELGERFNNNLLGGASASSVITPLRVPSPGRVPVRLFEPPRGY